MNEPAGSAHLHHFMGSWRWSVGRDRLCDGSKDTGREGAILREVRRRPRCCHAMQGLHGSCEGCRGAMLLA